MQFKKKNCLDFQGETDKLYLLTRHAQNNTLHLINFEELHESSF